MRPYVRIHENFDKKGNKYVTFCEMSHFRVHRIRLQKSHLEDERISSLNRASKAIKDLMIF